VTLAKATKDPNAILPFSIDWAEWISDIAGESVASASWSVDSPPDAALVIGATSVSGAVATAVVSGGTLGRSYNLRCRITTAPSSYIDDRTISVRVESR
jgi:hypothetical protein